MLPPVTQDPLALTLASPAGQREIFDQGAILHARSTRHLQSGKQRLHLQSGTHSQRKRDFQRR